MIITNDLIESFSTKQHGWKKNILEMLGVSWPPNRGWKSDLIGREVDDAVIEKIRAKMTAQTSLL
jgi:hypothetical protein